MQAKALCENEASGATPKDAKIAQRVALKVADAEAKVAELRREIRETESGDIYLEALKVVEVATANEVTEVVAAQELEMSGAGGGLDTKAARKAARKAAKAEKKRAKAEAKAARKAATQKLKAEKVCHPSPPPNFS